MNYEQLAVWSQVVSAVLFILAFVGIWVKWIGPAVVSANEANNNKIAEAERHRDEAKAALDALRQEIAGATHDGEVMRSRAFEQGEREKAREIAAARESGDRAVKNAQGELERSRAAAREALRTELLDKALSFAREEAERRIDASQNARLVDGFVSSLERVGGRG